MKKLLAIAALILLVNIQNVSAHSDHSHGPITAQEALELGKTVVAHLSTQDTGLGFGKLSENWKTLPIENIKLHTQGQGYYIVSVTNNPEKKTLFILMSSSGEVYDANFTGAFQGLD